MTDAARRRRPAAAPPAVRGGRPLDAVAVLLATARAAEGGPAALLPWRTARCSAGSSPSSPTLGVRAVVVTRPEWEARAERRASLGGPPRSGPCSPADDLRALGDRGRGATSALLVTYGDVVTPPRGARRPAGRPAGAHRRPRRRPAAPAGVPGPEPPRPPDQRRLAVPQRPPPERDASSASEGRPGDRPKRCRGRRAPRTRWRGRSRRLAGRARAQGRALARVAGDRAGRRRLRDARGGPSFEESTGRRAGRASEAAEARLRNRLRAAPDDVCRCCWSPSCAAGSRSGGPRREFFRPVRCRSRPSAAAGRTVAGIDEDRLRSTRRSRAPTASSPPSSSAPTRRSSPTSARRGWTPNQATVSMVIGVVAAAAFAIGRGRAWWPARSCSSSRSRSTASTASSPAIRARSPLGAGSTPSSTAARSTSSSPAGDRRRAASTRTCDPGRAPRSRSRPRAHARLLVRIGLAGSGRARVPPSTRGRAPRPDSPGAEAAEAGGAAGRPPLGGRGLPGSCGPRRCRRSAARRRWAGQADRRVPDRRALRAHLDHRGALRRPGDVHRAADLGRVAAALQRSDAPARAVSRGHATLDRDERLPRRRTARARDRRAGPGAARGDRAGVLGRGRSADGVPWRSRWTRCARRA